MPGVRAVTTKVRAARPRIGRAGRKRARGHLVEGHIQRDRVRLAVHRQIAGQAGGILSGHLDLRRFQFDGRIFRRVQEIRPAQMLVALVVIGVDAVGLNRQFDFGILRRRLVEREAAGDILELADHVGIAEMIDQEDDIRVRLVDREMLRLGLRRRRHGQSCGRRRRNGKCPGHAHKFRLRIMGPLRRRDDGVFNKCHVHHGCQTNEL
jgi:hypothetical protein